jgi:hypothetical protein
VTDLAAAVHALIQGVDGPAETLRSLAGDVCSARAAASPADRDDAVRLLASALTVDRCSQSGWLALAAGVLVESGAGATPLGGRLIDLLPGVFERARRYGEAALPSALTEEQSEKIDDNEPGLWLAERFVPIAHAELVARNDPEAAEAWQALGRWSAPAVACFSRDRRLRRVAADRLVDVAALAQIAEEVHCLEVLLSVLDDALFIVLHPESEQGFRVRVSGVADNFQLQTLLADALITRTNSGRLSWFRSRSGLTGSRPHPQAVAVAKGEGPQQSNVPSFGVWNLNQWTAIQADGTLPSRVDSAHWIWGEGRPADVLVFDAIRVILLGPPPYPRSWSTTRFFADVEASVVVDETLSRRGVRDWLRRLAAANTPALSPGP